MLQKGIPLPKMLCEYYTLLVYSMVPGVLTVLNQLMQRIG